MWQGVQKALNRGEAYHKLKRAVFHAHQGSLESKQNWNNISGVNLLTQVEKLEEAEVIKSISPIAWRHVNLLGRFEF